MKFLFIALMMSTSMVYGDTSVADDPSVKVIQILDKGLISEDCKDPVELRQSHDERLVIKDGEKYNRSPAVDKLFIKRIMKNSVQE